MLRAWEVIPNSDMSCQLRFRKCNSAWAFSKIRSGQGTGGTGNLSLFQSSPLSCLQCLSLALLFALSTNSESKGHLFVLCERLTTSLLHSTCWIMTTFRWNTAIHSSHFHGPPRRTRLRPVRLENDRPSSMNKPILTSH